MDTISKLTQSQPPLPFEAPAQHATAAARENARGAARVTTPATATASAAAHQKTKAPGGKIVPAILRAVELRGPAPDDCLTSLEILRAIYAAGAAPNAVNPNIVRPRLTEARNAGLLENPAAPGLFDADGKPKPFLKKVDGDEAAAVWRITARGREWLRQQEAQP